MAVVPYLNSIQKGGNGLFWQNELNIPKKLKIKII
jgi:hypothetical protein